MTALVRRAEGYRLLAQCIRHPDTSELRAELEAVPETLAGIADNLLAHADDEVAPEHVRLFARGGLVSPYQGSYLPGDKGVLLGQLAELYRLFGARVGGREREAPDHIGAELEFCALLALKEALCLDAGDSQRLELVSRARHVFMEDHLGRWAGAFARRLARETTHPFFAALAASLENWVSEDARELSVVLQPVPAALPVVDAGELSCETR